MDEERGAIRRKPSSLIVENWRCVPLGKRKRRLDMQVHPANTVHGQSGGKIVADLLARDNQQFSADGTLAAELLKLLYDV